MTGVRSLIASAFGSKACLYSHVLECNRNATPSELRKAYHRRALTYHPDKQTKKQRQQLADDDAVMKKATLCFQAVSAAYEILSDPGKRAFYDAAGELLGEDTDGAADAASTTCNSRKDEQQRWTRFFNSVFQGVVASAADAEHESVAYKGSEREAADVLRYYHMCKGDLDKVVTCVVLGEKSDKTRWKNDIIEPAIQRGEVHWFECASDVGRKRKGVTSRALVDTDDEEDQNYSSGKTTRKWGRGKSGHAQLSQRSSGKSLVVTGEGENPTTKSSSTASSSSPAAMSKKDKMDFRVAKKRKEKTEKEIQLAKLIKGKRWSGEGAASRSHPGTFSNNLIATLERKYSSVDGKGSVRPVSLPRKKMRRDGDR